MSLLYLFAPLHPRSSATLHFATSASLPSAGFCLLYPVSSLCLHFPPVVRVLQYRSVAFVTYVSELNAQFAKEAMACQSLDNDEILNVRWATEDPNPTSKVAEKRRLEEIGREAIQAKMDPRIVDAMRSMRALEDGVELDDMDPEPEVDSRGAKRQRMIEDDKDEEEVPYVPPPPQAQPESNSGILSSDALEGLKYFAEIRRKNGLGSAAAPPKAAPAAPLTAGLGLGDYASDDDD